MSIESRQSKHMVKDGDYTYCGDHFIAYKNIKLLCSKPETSVTVIYQFYLNLKRIYNFMSYIRTTIGTPDYSSGKN